MSYQKKRKKNPDNFGRRRTFGFPIDIQAVEDKQPGKNIAHHDDVRKAFFNACLSQGTPLSQLLDSESQEEKERLLSWLSDALERLQTKAPNQYFCIYHRFRFDGSERTRYIKRKRKFIKKETKTLREIAIITATSVMTVRTNIQSGLRTLKKDYDKNFKLIE